MPIVTPLKIAGGQLQQFQAGDTISPSIAPGSGGGGGMAVGTATVNFGAFPGKSDASAVITGQSAITGGSVVRAWLYPAATADHSADEHLVETINVTAGNVVAGVGFTIYATNSSELFESAQNTRRVPGGRGTRIYGQWTVAWSWN